MFKMFNRVLNKKGQNTAEYALLISLVVAAIIAMQTYAQRALQARIRDASLYMVNGTSGLGNTTQQYEPYYIQTNYDVTLETVSLEQLGNELVAVNESTTRTREGFRKDIYNQDETHGH
ncbi:MAG TPA: hypothetical protein VJA17_04535 [Candidatus Omnitrophota bacterium]|nr:hypothetical protein [Candidatus Omnitrophota bacterium]